MSTTLKALAVVQAIDSAYEKDKREKARRYIGASIVGTQCEAALAFNLRGFPNEEPDPHLKRIFGLGHKIEEMVVADLKKAGYAVFEVDGMTGKQFTYSEYGGHVVCHTDGLIEIEGQLHVLEIKSMNDASWGKFVNDGVKYSHPQYFAQVQMMMGMSRLPSALFIAYNKNNSKYHAEFVEFDPIEFSFIQERVGRALAGRVRKVSVDETDWRCRMCFKRGVCWEDRPVPQECQTCRFASPTADGWWHCEKRDEPAPGPACSHYEKFEPMKKGEAP